MQNLAKKTWGARLSVKSAVDVAVDWIIKARQKNILSDSNPELYYSYVLEDSPTLSYFQNVGQMFKYSQKDTPDVDVARVQLLKLLSVALKTHFFLFEDDYVSHEPYFFAFPDLSSPQKVVLGMYYKIEKDDKVIVVCNKDLRSLFEDQKILYYFPVVLIRDSFKWYHLKMWGRIKDKNLQDKGSKPWQLLNKDKPDFLFAKTLEELSEKAVVLDVPIELKDKMKPTGVLWAPNLKKWCLPHGYDVDAVVEYLNYLKKEIK